MKSENRNPKSATSLIRSGLRPDLDLNEVLQPEGRLILRYSEFGFRPSFGVRISDFGPLHDER